MKPITGPTVTDDRKEYVLRTTCKKNGGFRFYVPLPPQRVFQKAYWVLGSELEVRIKRKTAFINRETKWMRVPIYLTTNRGLLFVYIDPHKGYILRIPCAKKLNFEGIKKPKKLSKNKVIEGKYDYIATVQLVYGFGELHIRFEKDDNLRPWRTIMLAAHQMPQGLAKAGAQVVQEMSKLTSNSSVVSTKSIVPKGKNKVDEICLRRYNAFRRRTISELSLASKESSQILAQVNLTAAITSARASASGTSILSNVSYFSHVSGIAAARATNMGVVTIKELPKMRRDFLEEKPVNRSPSIQSLLSEQADEPSKLEVDENNELNVDNITHNSTSESTFSSGIMERGYRKYIDDLTAFSEIDVEVSSTTTVTPTDFTATEKIENNVSPDQKTSKIYASLPLIPSVGNSESSIDVTFDSDEKRFSFFGKQPSISHLSPIKSITSVVSPTNPGTPTTYSSASKSIAALQEKTAEKKPAILWPLLKNAPASGTAPPVAISSLQNKLDFWRNQELVHNNTARIDIKPVILGKKVQQKVKFINAKSDDNTGRIVSSPTRYFATVADAAKAVSCDEESHI